MRRYLFHVTLSGYGKDEDQAWNDAVEAFHSDPGPYPEEFSIDEDDCCEEEEREPVNKDEYFDQLEEERQFNHEAGLDG